MDVKGISKKQQIEALAARSFFRALSWVPIAISIPVCRSIASFIYFVDGKHRRIGMINLDIAFPEKSREWKKKILHQSFRQQGVHAVELSRLARLTPEQLRKKVSYDQSFRYYEKIKGEGRGLIFMTAHLGCWELISTAHGAHGNRLHVLVRPLDNPRLDQWLSSIRNRFGGGVINKNNALRQMLALLKKGEEVGILPDQNVQEKDGLYVPLFGRPASTSAGLAAIAQKTKSPVIPAFILPGDQSGTYVIRMHPPIEFTSTDDRKRDLEVNTAIYNQHLEKAIREYPEGWLWGHRRFKTQPDGSDPYS